MSKGMHPEDIKAEIRKRGTTMKALSISWGFSEATVRAALTNPMPSVEPMISRFIGIPLYKIWPDRYDRENIRIRPISDRRKGRRKKTQCHCKKVSSKSTAVENRSELKKGGKNAY